MPAQPDSLVSLFLGLGNSILILFGMIFRVWVSILDLVCCLPVSFLLFIHPYSCPYYLTLEIVVVPGENSVSAVTSSSSHPQPTVRISSFIFIALSFVFAAT